MKIGILQYAQHPSLDNCYEGVLQGLAEAGYTDGENGVSIEFQNANGSTSDADLMAKTMVSTGCDMIIAVATPAAMSLCCSQRCGRARNLRRGFRSHRFWSCQRS